MLIQRVSISFPQNFFSCFFSCFLFVFLAIKSIFFRFQINFFVKNILNFFYRAQFRSNSCHDHALLTTESPSSILLEYFRGFVLSHTLAARVCVRLMCYVFYSYMIFLTSISRYERSMCDLTTIHKTLGETSFCVSYTR